MKDIKAVKLSGSEVKEYEQILAKACLGFLTSWKRRDA